ncbi:hypothetical protein M413DRAFT_32752 [Hebeloma cylindrosporum]|uniref:Uncharacterized protein n=1 Tax=Hebeloma cylindrosporum TaxID=76867 RepID=A0A0C3BSV2_HEBCY|nr:hypothetical protein M413DRAFT_32752 [Hebeloma cylindrosporum h7]
MDMTIDLMFKNIHKTSFLIAARTLLPLALSFFACTYGCRDNSCNVFGRYFSRNPIETISLVYDHVPHMGASGRTPEHKRDWKAMLRFLGFVNGLDQLDIPEPEKSAMMMHFSSMASTNVADPITEAFATVSGPLLSRMSAALVPSDNLSVFSSPRPSGFSGFIPQFQPSTSVSVDTSLKIPKVFHSVPSFHFPVVHDKQPSPRSTRRECIGKTTTHSRRQTLMWHNAGLSICLDITSGPQRRAALLRGGIVGRIAKEYLSKDGVLDGRSIAVTAHRVGYLAPSAQGERYPILFCDDQMTGDEIVIICGTYSLYTPYAGQVAV